jgi:predicted membrane-bound spermidine synthase
MGSTVVPSERVQQAGGSARFLLLTVFLAGIGTLGVEMLMSRKLAPFFGTSQPIWAVVIGMTLVYLAIGYRLGGSLADRRPDERLLYAMIAWAGFLTGFIPLLSRPILRVAQQALSSVAAGSFLGALVGVVLLFAAPVILMATVSPFAVRLQMRRASEGVEAAGRIAGSLSSLSTLGSIIGTFLPVLVLVPALGTDVTMYIFAFFLMLLGLIGARDWRFALMLVVVAGLAAYTVTSSSGIKAADCRRCTVVAEVESGENYIQVATQQTPYEDGTVDPRVNLILNEGQAIHSIYRTRFRDTGDPMDLLTGGGPWDYFAVTPYFFPDRDPQQVKSLAMLGSAAGTVPKQFLALYGDTIRIDAVEIDQGIIDVGRKYFDMQDGDPRFPNFIVHHDDARFWLATADEQYDVIAMDAYHQPYIPFHLTTVEFFQEVKARLSDDGVAVVNAGRPPSGDDRLVNAIASTMRAVYPQVFIIDTAGFSNAIVVGVNRPVGDGVANFAANARRIQTPALRTVMEWALTRGRGPVREFTPQDAQFAPFTDDHAPVEQLIDTLILGEAGRAE